ncbi:MAG: winged helix-turn-helix transcriptional regulator [Proteobacteria bacterium]|nr:winged helix-turn-helix transcriptional regulator [Pseudomonadota bacterium]
MNVFANPEQLRAAADLLKTLANRHRLAVLCLLVEGEKSVGGLQARLGIAQPALSQQLARLRREHLVRTRKTSQTVYYALADRRVRRILDTLHDLFCRVPGKEPSAAATAVNQGDNRCRSTAP